jgi:hypothetical protein
METKHFNDFPADLPREALSKHVIVSAAIHPMDFTPHRVGFS